MKDINLSTAKSKKELNPVEIDRELFILSKTKQILFLLSLSQKQIQEYIKYKKFLKKKMLKPKKDFDEKNAFEVRDFNLWYLHGKKQALFDINVDIKKNKVTALIGPSGCGKSTFLRNLNRLNDTIEGVLTSGDIYFDKINIKSKNLTELELRTRVGLVFQKATPFHMSIYDNIAFGPRSHGIKDKNLLDKIVENSLKSAALWDEVSDELDKLGTDLSGGQKQRLCIARTIALNPEVILMDEPTSALDPISTGKIEDLILQLKEKFTIVIVTHSMNQASRISDETIFFYKGLIKEHSDTRELFTNPKEKITKDYISGKL